MAQAQVWDREYRKPQLLTKKAEPQTDTKDFLRYLRKQVGQSVEGLKVLDLGSGTGRNSNYLAELGNEVTGLELSPTAVDLARARAEAAGLKVDYKVANFGAAFNLPANSFDLALDVMSSNSLNEAERTIYLSELNRVLKPGAWVFVRTLCKEGDKNAKKLLKLHPGPEHDTYINPDMDLVERVFSREDLRALYQDNFEIKKLELKTNYARFGGQSYRRNYWLLYLQKR